MKKKLAVFTTHPVQYHVPIWRKLACEACIEETVFYFSRHGLGKSFDPGFDAMVQWDLDLLSGYRHEFLGDIEFRNFSYCRIDTSMDSFSKMASETVLLHGYQFPFSRQLRRWKGPSKFKLILRGEFTDRFQRNGLKRLIRNRYLKWFYSGVDRFCYIGTDARRHLLSMGIGEEKLFFSPYSIDDDLFRSMRRSVHREDARKMLAINDEFVILYSAKLIPRKNPIFIANLFKRLSQLKPGRFKLIMLGDGPQWNQTNAILHEEIEKRIAILPGFTNQTELGLYFAAADLFVLPSSKDSWGVVVNEAMSFGLPCVVSDQVGCGIDLIREGVTGYTLPVCQERWLETILRLSGKEFDIGRMRTAATEHISSFSSERAAAGIREAVLN